eukprot:4590959-Pleurochrysis_carterae.AAC.2
MPPLGWDRRERVGRAVPPLSLIGLYVLRDEHAEGALGRERVQQARESVCVGGHGPGVGLGDEGGGGGGGGGVEARGERLDGRDGVALLR